MTKDAELKALRAMLKDAALSLELLWSACDQGKHMHPTEVRHIKRTLTTLLAYHQP
jgi:hypothetical protein